ncbi:hypothetical protein [Sabulicella glaciei]|uniref:Uncharacterized protein n=1 Tax=Sabulicella glaciei TaxID=2984948 RepID=A0ABT3NYX5_9PROT|nr:hypothetical protein [Roseococcus sp. MDT2-1-1]MCW8087359.1 hypothetical protein [Roseococcus sp. MDT2-1-1]
MALLLQQPPERRSMGLEGARILAREMRDWIRDGTDLVHSAVGVRSDCSFDLHSLVPILWRVLQLGPDDPKSLAWMWENWGTTWTLRRVEEVPLAKAGKKMVALGQSLVRYRFWSADWSLYQPLEKLRGELPALSVRLSYQVEWPDLQQINEASRGEAAAASDRRAAQELGSAAILTKGPAPAGA